MPEIDLTCLLWSVVIIFLWETETYKPAVDRASLTSFEGVELEVIWYSYGTICSLMILVRIRAGGYIYKNVHAKVLAES